MATKNNRLKQKFYVFSFAVLGLLMSLVVYGVVSIVIINHGLDVNLVTYFWIMMAAGLIAGVVEGKRWWRIIYVQKAYLKWPKHKLEMKLLGLMILIVLTVVFLFSINYKM